MPSTPQSKRAKAGGTPADLERFRTRNRAEIQRVLTDLARGTELATIYFNQGKEFVLSAVVHYDADARVVYLDYGVDEEDNRRLLAGERPQVVSSHHRVRVQFPANAIARSEWDGHPAFRVDEPATLIRVQRREYYRLDIPHAYPLACRFITERGQGIDAEVVDISIGGIGILEPKDMPGELLAPGEVIPLCRIELPGMGTLETGVEIRNLVDPRKPDAPRRVGCRFLDLEPRQTSRLQRYIQKVELERRRMARDR